MLSNSMVHTLPEVAHNYLDGQIMSCFHKTQRLIIVYFDTYAVPAQTSLQFINLFLQYFSLLVVVPKILYAFSVFSMCGKLHAHVILFV
jgi:hypothetical protein